MTRSHVGTDPTAPSAGYDWNLVPLGKWPWVGPPASNLPGMSRYMFAALAAVVLVGAGCGSDSNGAAMTAACEALAVGEWQGVDQAYEQVSDEVDEETLEDDPHLDKLLHDLGILLEAQRAFEPTPGVISSLELRGNYAVDYVKDGFDGAWIACSSYTPDMPAALGSEYQGVWDEIGIDLYRLLQ